MTLRALIQRLAQQELDWQGRSLLAPVVAPGRARVRLQGLVYELSIVPADYRGFGVFSLNAPGVAEFVRSATPPERENYLRLWPRRQMRLLHEVVAGNWMTRLGMIHEVERGSPFELVEAAFDGRNYWYCRPVLDTRLALAEEMARALAEHVPAAELRLKGMTPEDRAGYAALCRRVPGGGGNPPLIPGGPEPRVGVVVEGGDHLRLTRALARGGGSLRSFSLSGDTYQVSWEDSRGENHFSAIRRDDLTVLSSGICLSGRDSDFDLTSLVGVMEEEE
jgi:hypothetical protein